MTAPAPAGVPKYLLPHFFPHYGVYVSFIGDDDQLVALGHHGNFRAVIAAFNRHASVDVGLGNIDDWEPFSEGPHVVEQVWAVETTGAFSDEWQLFTHVPQDMPDAFPITVPACCDCGPASAEPAEQWHDQLCPIGKGATVAGALAQRGQVALGEIARNQ